MKQRRRRFLQCVGASGVGTVAGCLRLSTSATDTADTDTGTQSESATTTTRAPAFSVTVVGRKFRWGFSYPAFDLTDRQELVVPADTSVELAVTSDDVLHGFAVEELDVDVDAVPDERTATTLTPETTGEHTAFCTEYCGDGHSEMTAPVRVVPEAEFDRWRS